MRTHFDADDLRDQLPPGSEGIAALLRLARSCLGLDLCCVAEIAQGKRTIRYVEGDASSFGFPVGVTEPLEDSYCVRMLDGRIPGLVCDTRAHPETRGLEATSTRNIGCFIGFPIVLPSGRVYGTLVALGHEARNDLDARDVAFLQSIADLVAETIEANVDSVTEAMKRRADVERLIDDPDGLAIVLQPVFDLATRRLHGYEALSRFAEGPPEPVFASAWDVGLGVELELKAIESATALLDSLEPATVISVNASPRTVLSEGFSKLLCEATTNRLVVEITEHDAIECYDEVTAALGEILDRGVMLAIDDVGAGYASLSHIMELSPDIIKLDAAFVRDLGDDRIRTALTTALVSFAHEIDAVVVAEGVETRSQLAALRRLSVDRGQGFYLGRPMPFGEIDLR